MRRPYARQSEDTTLEAYAKRIRGRAVRRAGELLKAIEPGQGARDGKRGEGSHTPLRQELAQSAGMSPHQAKQAIRVASVPDDEYDAAQDRGEVAGNGQRGPEKAVADANSFSGGLAGHKENSAPCNKRHNATRVAAYTNVVTVRRTSRDK